jgi:HSP20 family protein
VNIIRWNPAFDLLNVHSELDRVFNELVSGSGFSPRYAGEGRAPAFLPIDVRRDGGNVVVEASVPGFTPEEVSVTFDGGVLTISATHEEQTQAKGDYVRQERHVGQVYRQISLGDQVDGDNAQAAFANGVLTVTVPLMTKPEPRRIPVSSSDTSATENSATE